VGGELVPLLSRHQSATLYGSASDLPAGTKKNPEPKMLRDFFI
jgi:hypothetical protein